MASGLISGYLGEGLTADRPATPDIGSGTIAVYYSTDDLEVSIYAGGGWHENVLGAGAGDMLAANNLDDLVSATTALTNLGLSANGKSLVTAANYAAMKTLLGLVIGTDVQAYSAVLANVASSTYDAALKPLEHIQIACSDESTAITTGTAKVTFRMPYAFTVTDVRASVNTAPTGSTILIDINEAGTTILSTKLMIDASEKTSTTAATPYVISDASLADDAEITIDFDQVGSTIAGKGVKVILIGHRT